MPFELGAQLEELFAAKRAVVQGIEPVQKPEPHRNAASQTPRLGHVAFDVPVKSVGLNLGRGKEPSRLPSTQ